MSHGPAVSQSCFHCGDALGRFPLTARVNESDEAVCCAGCKAVAELIAGAGLTDYYRFRAVPAERPDSTVMTADAWSSYAQAAVTSRFVRRRADIDSVTILIENLRCPACAWLIERLLRDCDGIVSVNTNAATGRVCVSWQHTRVNLADVMRTIAAAGYRPCLPGDESQLLAQQQEHRATLRRLAVAGFGMMQVMMFAVASYTAELNNEVIEPSLDAFFRIVSMLVATPVIAYAGVPIFASAWRSLRLRAIGMDVPIALALVLAYGASVYNTLLDTNGSVYFDSVTMFVFFVILGRFVQMSLRHRTTSLGDALARQLPLLAHRIEHGEVMDVPAASLALNDLLLVRSGEILPADGIVIGGEASIDESLLTGESAPVRRRAGEPATGGTLNIGDSIRLQVTALQDETTLSQIVRLLHSAQGSRPALSQAADRASAMFLVGVLFAAALTAGIWFVADAERAFEATLAVLVVACPCAFAIGMPAALSAAMTHLATRGVLIVKPDAVEALAAVDHVEFDKTGTLTQARLAVQRCVAPPDFDERRARQIAASIESMSEHPIARAFAQFGAGPAPENVHHYCGQGLEARIGGQLYRIGTPEFVADLRGDIAAVLSPPASGSTLIMLGDEHRALAQFELNDELRTNARNSIAALSHMAVTTEILSGDSASSVESVARACGIRHSLARCSPVQKLARIHALQKKGRRVAMVGDGVNDAPVLAAAHVSIAMGRGTALAHASADMILVSEDLRAIPTAIEVARRTLAIARQNRMWAAVYNFGSLPLAAMGVIPPWLAALGMSLSSVLVMANAMRLLPPRAPPARLSRSEPPPGSVKLTTAGAPT